MPIMTDINCFSCPSLLNTSEAQDFFGKNIGVPVCARFGKPVGTITSGGHQQKEVATILAANCGKYGEPRPSSADWSSASFSVALPDPSVMQFNRRRDQDTVSNCQSCEHMVAADVVASELGFATQMCSAKGKLILPSRMTYEARNCDDRSLARNGVRRDVTGIMMLPEYNATWTPSTDPVRHHAQQQAMGSPEPEDYVTDREVTEEQAATGIRAWRKVEDPETSLSTYLPIYRLDYFSEEERAKIPRAGDDEHPEDYIDHNFFIYKVAVLWMELDETPGMWGEAGTGKTELFRHLAYLMCLPFERISITGSTELDDLFGKMHYSKDVGTYWKDGRLVEAWSKPCVLVVDEPNAGPPDVWQAMRPMTDNSKQLVVDMSDDPRPRQRHDSCFLGLAMNPAWDPRNIGTHQVSDADVNRLMHIYVERPPELLEREIISKRCAHDGYEIGKTEKLDIIMRIAADIRALAEEQTLPISWAIRPQLKVARASRWFDLKTCYRMATADFLEPSQSETIMDIVRSHVE